MTAPKLSHDALGERLSGIEGFEAGRALQEKIMRLGAQLRRLREDALGLTQAQAAELLGIHQGELSRLESGQSIRGPSFSTLDNLLERYQAALRARAGGERREITLQVSGSRDADRAITVAIREPPGLGDAGV